MFNVCLITSISCALISCFFGLIRFEQSIKKTHTLFLIAQNWGKKQTLLECLLLLAKYSIVTQLWYLSSHQYFISKCVFSIKLSSSEPTKPTHSVSSLSTRLPPEWPSCYRTLYLIKTAKGASITALERGFYGSGVTSTS